MDNNLVDIDQSGTEDESEEIETDIFNEDEPIELGTANPENLVCIRTFF